MSVVDIGIPGVDQIPPGTHLCALYSGSAERDDLLFPFLREGLRHGDTCLCYIDGLEPGAVRAQAVGEAGVADPPTIGSTCARRRRSTCSPESSRSST